VLTKHLTLRLVAVEIEAVSIDIFHGELTQTPGLLLERFNNSRTQRAQFVICRVKVRRKYPVNGGFEWLASSAKEDCDLIARHSTDLPSRVKPADLETERIAVMLLSSLNVRNWELGSGMAERRPQFRLVHGILSYASELVSAEYQFNTRKARSVFHRLARPAQG
jgi:hypothetical protein